MQYIKDVWHDFKIFSWPVWKRRLQFFGVCFVIAIFLNFHSVGSSEDYDAYCDSDALYGSCGSSRQFSGDWGAVLNKAINLFIFGYIARYVLDEIYEDKERLSS